ncbi:hypothetical protein LDO32_01310 [Luteimonas sp. Y-2-2-4F]|nr:hypothetical protein [Luteimonas sp. Y-2-2-4F]MCD9030373.1 hypothetical protein [Luteimonas sp. Y-2-2-4F]
MSRITDTERGARIALAMAEQLGMQPDLYADALPVEFWHAIADAARLELDDQHALRAAIR